MANASYDASTEAASAFVQSIGDDQASRSAEFRKLLEQMNSDELRQMSDFMAAYKKRAAARDAIATVGLNQYVNTIFAAYVAIETEQYRLGALGTPEAEAEANALGDNALALAIELDAIDDYSGSADLAAARALHELMLLNPWDRLGEFEWGEDSRDHLSVVAALANLTTGAVREQARRVMATKGIEIAPETPDPLVDLINRYKAEEDRLNDAGLTDDEMSAEIVHLNELLNELRNWTAPATTKASAAIALRFAYDFMQHSNGGYEDAMIAAALGYLEGRAGA